jgi:ABC-type multidrug transport system ATPase subunit
MKLRKIIEWKHLSLIHNKTNKHILSNLSGSVNCG